MDLFAYDDGDTAEETRSLTGGFGLTPAEADMARLAIEGCTSTQIAARRGVLPLTVRTQLRAILTKTRAPNLRALTVMAMAAR